MSTHATLGVVLVMLGAVCAMSSAAHAQATPGWAMAADRERPPPLESEREAPTVWYGWQTLLADTLSLGIIAAGVIPWKDRGRNDSAQNTLLVFGLAGYLAATPLVHYYGHHNEWALYSLVLRVVAPAIVVGSAFILRRAFDDRQGPLPDWIPIAGLVGLIAGVVMMAGVPIADAALATKKRARPGPGLTAFISPRVDGAGLLFSAQL